MSKTIELRKDIQKLFKEVTDKVYYRRAINSNIYPHVVYTIEDIGDAKSLNIDIWDKSESTERIEILADEIEAHLKDEVVTKSTADLFSKICDVLELSKSTFENKIGDFYTALTTDKRFLLLEDGNWDLKSNHSVKKLNLDDAYDEEDEEIEEPNEDVEEDFDDTEKDIYDDVTEDDDDITDEYKDLVIVDEDELESGE